MNFPFVIERNEIENKYPRVIKAEYIKSIEYIRKNLKLAIIYWNFFFHVPGSKYESHFSGEKKDKRGECKL